MTNLQLATVPKDLRHSNSSPCTISLSSSANKPTNIPTSFSTYMITLNINISAYDLWITTLSRDPGERDCSTLHCYLSVLWPQRTWLFCEIIKKMACYSTNLNPKDMEKQQTANTRQQTSCFPGTVRAWGLISRLMMYVWCTYTHPRGWRADA